MIFCVHEPQYAAQDPSFGYTYSVQTSISDTQVSCPLISLSPYLPLIYYERADREGYAAAIDSIFPKERTVIESIRTRTVPFGQPEAEAGQRLR
jgi:hypothetical protein